MGLLKALDRYENKDREKEVAGNIAKVQYLCEEINKIPGLKAEQIQDEAGRAIYRARVTLDASGNAQGENTRTADQINQELRNGDPKIYARTEFSIWARSTLTPDRWWTEIRNLIVKRLREIMRVKKWD